MSVGTVTSDTVAVVAVVTVLIVGIANAGALEEGLALVEPGELGVDLADEVGGGHRPSKLIVGLPTMPIIFIILVIKVK